MRYYDGYPEYVPVHERRAKAQKKLQQLRKQQPNIKPVVLTGQTLATTWWGKSWNSNLERYADYSNRISRGRSYVRHGAVLDLQITTGAVTALIQGSRPQPYKIAIKVDTLNAANWDTIRQACADGLDSLSELLAGKFPATLKELFFAKGAGLFPAPQEIHFDCSCPDWASMCKHVAATLYGVGARLDEDAALFFTLRGIRIDDMITQTATETAQALLHKAQRQSTHVLEDVDLGDVFGIQLDDLDMPLPGSTAATPRKASTTRSAPKSSKARTTAASPLVSKQRTRLSLPTVAPKTSGARAAASPPQTGSMLQRIVKAVGKARQGKSVEQLQQKLGWTKTQIRNAISRASAQGLVENIAPGRYRQKV